MTNLPRGVFVGIGRESIGERFVVECTAFNEMAEVFDREIDSQKLTVECTVSCFGWLELL